MAKKEIIELPNWIEPMGILHATCVVEDEMGLNPGDDGYEKAFEKACYEFYDEFYQDSSVPKAMNPTWRGGINAFDAFENSLFKGSNSFLGSRVTSEEERKHMAGQIRRAVTSLVSVYLKAELKNDKYGYNHISSKSENKKEELMKAQVSRYERLLIISSILASVEMVFSIKGSELKSVVSDIIGKKTWKELSTSVAHRAFAEGVKNKINESLQNEKPLELIGEMAKTDFIKEYK
jgi:hypothetical protein